MVECSFTNEALVGSSPVAITHRIFKFTQRICKFVFLWGIWQIQDVLQNIVAKPYLTVFCLYLIRKRIKLRVFCQHKKKLPMTGERIHLLFYKLQSIILANFFGELFSLYYFLKNIFKVSLIVTTYYLNRSFVYSVDEIISFLKDNIQIRF